MLDRDAFHNAADTLAAQPSFEPVMQRLAGATVNTFSDQWMLNRLIRDSARFALLAVLLDLHHRRAQPSGGITMARVLRQFARGSAQGPQAHLAGAGRVKAMLAMLALLPGVGAIAD